MNGIDCKLYVKTGGSHGSPTWTEADLVNDAKVTPKAQEQAANIRASIVDLSDVTSLQIEITGNIRVPKVGATNAPFDTLDAVFHARSEVEVLVLRGAKTVEGVTGYRLPVKVFEWPEDQGRGTVLYKDFTLKPCPSDYKCQLVTVDTGPSLVFTDI